MLDKLPLQKWECAAYVLRLWCSECCTCASCTYVQATAIPHRCAACMLLVYATCAAGTHACYTSVSCMYACYNVLHICRLHTCKLLVFLICVACIHAYYYSAAYTLHILDMYTVYIRHIVYHIHPSAIGVIQ